MNRVRNPMFISAVLFTLGTVSFTFDQSGVQWMWAEVPVVGVVLGAVALFFWSAFAVQLPT